MKKKSPLSSRFGHGMDVDHSLQEEDGGVENGFWRDGGEQSKRKKCALCGSK